MYVSNAHSLDVWATDVEFNVPHILEMVGACDPLIGQHSGQKRASRGRWHRSLLCWDPSAWLIRVVVKEMECEAWWESTEKKTIKKSQMMEMSLCLQGSHIYYCVLLLCLEGGYTHGSSSFIRLWPGGRGYSDRAFSQNALSHGSITASDLQTKTNENIIKTYANYKAAINMIIPTGY